MREPVPPWRSWWLLAGTPAIAAETVDYVMLWRCFFQPGTASRDNRARWNVTLAYVELCRFCSCSMGRFPNVHVSRCRPEGRLNYAEVV